MNDLTLREALNMAIERSDGKLFRKILNKGLDVQMVFPTEGCSTTSISLVEKLARCQFADGLRVLLLERLPCQVDRIDAMVAFNRCVTACASKDVIRVFLEASLNGTLPLLNLLNVYRYAMDNRCYDLAQQSVTNPRFPTNGYVCSDTHWEQPLHTAIYSSQVEIATQLLAKGAQVNAVKCTGASPLMLACGRICADSCRLLLTYGANPNHPQVNKRGTWPLSGIDYLFRCQNGFHIPKYPDFEVKYPISRFTKNADCIIEMLIKAGLRPSTRSWLQKSTVMLHISPETGTKLRDLNKEVKPLSELAVIDARNYITSNSETTSFVQMVSNLQIPYFLKEQLTGLQKELLEIQNNTFSSKRPQTNLNFNIKSRA